VLLQSIKISLPIEGGETKQYTKKWKKCFADFFHRLSFSFRLPGGIDPVKGLTFFVDDKHWVSVLYFTQLTKSSFYLAMI
jgi:hypothetical protein